MFLQQPDLIGGTINILPILSFVMGIAITIIQLYVASRMAKQEEKILKILREEREKELSVIKAEIKEVEYDVNLRIDRAKSQMITKDEFSLKGKISEHELQNKVADRLIQMINQAKNELKTELKTFIRNNNKPSS